MKNVEIIIRTKAKIKSRQWWNKTLERVKKILLRELPEQKLQIFRNSKITLLITNNKEIQDLNKYFRKVNKPTDVLSFHLNFKEQIKRKYLGDIAISAEMALKQAKRKKIKSENELSMLLIHGYLHLLKYDHMTVKDTKKMFLLQNKVLKEL